MLFISTSSSCQAALVSALVMSAGSWTALGAPMYGSTSAATRRSEGFPPPPSLNNYQRTSAYGPAVPVPKAYPNRHSVTPRTTSDDEDDESNVSLSFTSLLSESIRRHAGTTTSGGVVSGIDFVNHDGKDGKSLVKVASAVAKIVPPTDQECSAWQAYSPELSRAAGCKIPALYELDAREPLRPETQVSSAPTYPAEDNTRYFQRGASSSRGARSDEAAEDADDEYTAETISTNHFPQRAIQVQRYNAAASAAPHATHKKKYALSANGFPIRNSAKLDTTDEEDAIFGKMDDIEEEIQEGIQDGYRSDDEEEEAYVNPKSTLFWKAMSQEKSLPELTSGSDYYKALRPKSSSIRRLGLPSI